MWIGLFKSHFFNPSHLWGLLRMNQTKWVKQGSNLFLEWEILLHIQMINPKFDNAKLLGKKNELFFKKLIIWTWSAIW